MKVQITVSSLELYQKLKAVSKAISKKSTIPALDYFHFHIFNNQLFVTGSDTECSVVTSVETHAIEGNAEAAFLVEHKLLLEALKALPEQPVVFTTDTQSFISEIKHESGKFTVSGMDVSEYSILEQSFTEAETLKIDSAVLISGIKSVIPFVSNDELRPVLSNVYIESMENKTLNFVGSNANYMAIRQFNFKGFKDYCFMLPYKAAKIITDLIQESADEILIEFGERILTVESNSIEINCRLTDGKYPNYRSVIPQKNDKKVTVEKQLLLSALHRVSLFSNQESRLVKLSVKDAEIKIEANDYDFNNSAVEKVKCEHEGDSVEIGFKSTFLIQSVGSITATDVIMTLSDSTKPALFFSVNDNDRLTVLLMPMLINV